jgi:hypothetical protein
MRMGEFLRQSSTNPIGDATMPGASEAVVKGSLALLACLSSPLPARTNSGSSGRVTFTPGRPE